MRLKRIVLAVETLQSRHAELVSASIHEPAPWEQEARWTLKQVQGDDYDMWVSFFSSFDGAMCDDLNTPIAITVLEEALARKKVQPLEKLKVVAAMDAVLGLNLLNVTRQDLRIRPKSATITEAKIEDALARRKAARAEKDFATSDALRDELAVKGVEVMDGDPLGWEWKLD